MSSAQPDDIPRKQPVSVRKAEANRKNASKSTGPRTARGKANSRKNAIKHGLFVRQIDDYLTEDDEGEAFTTFHKRLWDELKPVGPREENEIAYIAICWLRLDRLWRYENAEIKSARHRVELEKEKGYYHPYFQVEQRRKIMSLLQSAKAVAERDGHIPSEMLGKIFEEDPALEVKWPDFKAQAGDLARESIKEIAKTMADERKIPLGEAKRLLTENPESTPEFARFVAAETVNKLMYFRWNPWWKESEDIKQTALQRETIPNGSVDKVIRYGNAIERQMSRAHARLERLQSRRRGEDVPAPVDVYLTR